MILSAFLYHLICSSFNCDYNNPHPDTGLSTSQSSNRSSRSFFKTEPVVLTNNGGFEGYMMTIASGRQIYAFEGIPYAEPPIGDNRFRDPIPKRPSYEIRPAKAPGPDCPQMSLPRLFRIVGKEDCLYLNIYSKEIPAPGMISKKYPVIIYVHGGNFFYSAGREFGPAYLLNEDVLLVTINYRLGPLGFMSTGDEESLGNWGLKDQALAIKWVSDNIASFGGDPSKITLAGQSAGAVCVNHQMLSTTSVARDLFIRAISLSGTSFNFWGLQTPEYARLLTDKVAETLGCPIDRGSKAIVDCLRKVDANFLVGAPRRLLVAWFFPLMFFSPVIEPNVTGAFLTAPPETYYEQDLVMKIPYWATNTADESGFLHMAFDNLALDSYFLMNWRKVLPLVLDYGRYLEFPQFATEAIGATYFGPKNVVDNGLRLDRKVFYEIGDDRYFSVGNRRALKAHSQVAPTYSYIYEFRSESSIATSIYHDFRKWNATHGDDLTSILNSTLLYIPFKPGSVHAEVSKKMTSLIFNFADKGVPFLTREDGTLEEIWKPITSPKDPLPFLNIGTDGSFKMISESSDKIRKLKTWDWLGL